MNTTTNNTDEQKHPIEFSTSVTHPEPVEDTQHIPMYGTWLVYFGISNILEGNYVLTFAGMFDKTTLVDTICDYIYDWLPDEGKAVVDTSPSKLVIRNLVRLS